jgi:hypothetical protein
VSDPTDPELAAVAADRLDELELSALADAVRRAAQRLAVLGRLEWTPAVLGELGAGPGRWLWRSGRVYQETHSTAPPRLVLEASWVLDPGPVPGGGRVTGPDGPLADALARATGLPPPPRVSWVRVPVDPEPSLIESGGAVWVGTCPVCATAGARAPLAVRLDRAAMTPEGGARVGRCYRCGTVLYGAPG